MQKQKIARVYGVTKAEYARRVQELETLTAAPKRNSGGGFFARFMKRAR